MTGNIVTLGCNSNLVRSQSLFAYSLDASSWTVANSPVWLGYSQIRTVSQGASSIAMLSDTGQVATGSSLTSMTPVSYIANTAGWFNSMGSTYDGTRFWAAGQLRNIQEDTEEGQIYQSVAGWIGIDTDDGATYLTNPGGNVAVYTAQQGGVWSSAFTLPNDNSIFYSINYIENAPISPTSTGNVLIACGHDNKVGVIYYCTDGVTWNLLSLPVEFQSRECYNVVLSENTLYFSCWGIILNINYLQTGTWSSSSELVTTKSQTDFRWIATNSSNELVAVCSGGIFYSGDRERWTTFTAPGITFRGVTWYNGTWIVGSESLLQDYQIWTSTDGITWTGKHSGIHSQDIALLF